MESSRILGCNDECGRSGSTESGWTTYIASPIQENHDHHHCYNPDDNDEEEDHRTYKLADFNMKNYSNDGGGGGESDDSMASDASSGPSHHEIPCKSNERNVGTDSFKRGTTKNSSTEKLNKQVKQRDGARERIKVGKQELELQAKSASSRVHGGTKVRRA